MVSAAAAITAWVAVGQRGQLLRIIDNEIRCLPPLPPTLLHLACGDCALLTDLGCLPASLRTLDCWKCPALESLPPLPPLLRELLCRSCVSLRTLPSLPASLLELCCWRCSVATMPPLPLNLKRLWCRECPVLHALGCLPAGLKELYCLRCPCLTSLPPLPSGMRCLECEGVPLARMLALPAGLRELYVGCGIRLPDTQPRSCVVAVAYNRMTWRMHVAAWHGADRGATAACLPSAALQYV